MAKGHLKTIGLGIAGLSLIASSIFAVPHAFAEEASGVCLTFGGGSGASTSPYQIASVDNLTDLATCVNSGNTYSGSYFTLTSDLDLSGISNWAPIGTGYFSGNYSSEQKAFAGVFDGASHTISGLTVTRTNEELSLDASNTTKNAGNNYNYNVSNKYSAKGLFGYVTGTVENLTISGANIEGWNAEAALVGKLADGTISGVTVSDSTVWGAFENAGSLVGMASGDIKVSNNKADGNKISISYNKDSDADNENQNGAGGLMGRTQSGNPTISGNTVTNTTVSAYRKAAGLVGYVLQPTKAVLADNKVEDATITINDNAKNKAGGEYWGVFTAEIQASPNTTRGFETAGESTDVIWYDNGVKNENSDKASIYSADSTNTYARVNYSSSVTAEENEVSNGTISTATGEESTSVLKEALDKRAEASEGGTYDKITSIEVSATDLDFTTHQDVVSIISEKASANNLTPVGSYDININYLENGQVIDQITELGSAIKINVALDEVPELADGYTRTWYVVRVHLNETTGEYETKILPATFDEATKTVAFESDKFSAFTVAYVDTESATEDKGSTTESTDSEWTSIDSDDSTDETEETSENPDTFDPILSVVALTVVSVLVAASSVVFLKR